jgi:hypothetical protein
MYFKSLLTAIFAILLIISTEAKTIDQNEAKKVATNYIYITANTYGKSLAFADIRLSDPFTYRVANTPAFYAFQMNPGFVIVSADDSFVPVIGYSFEGQFDFYNAPASYKGFLDNYAGAIKYIRDNQLEPAPEIKALWSELRTDNITGVAISRDSRDVAPLISSTWDQGSPYNIFCPEDAAGPGGHVWVGCVATAMAQIMYYWRYPETGTGSHCYTPGNSTYGQQCANFAQTTYDWSGMKNGIDNRFPDANATLQYHCAVAVNMDFGVDGSGAQSNNVPPRLNQYFRYSGAVYEDRQDYSYANWVSLLKADIDVGKPIYYSGYNDSYSGHAFVCDGYQGENFHFNFGWSGSENGYYSLYDINGFHNWQACVRNFAPTDNTYPYYSTGTKTLTTRSGSITDGSGPLNSYLDNTTAYWIINPQTIYDSITSITLTFSQFSLVAGDTVKIFNGPTTSSPVLGAFSGSTIPPSISTTQNVMMIQFKSNSSGTSSGFYAEYTSMSPSWCQGLTALTAPEGTFNDGSGDFYYQSQATCMWRINPQFANKITLNFNYFDTEEGVDKVTVYDGTTKIAELSGNQIPDPIEATSGMMFITWNTNAANNFQGWEAYYEVDNVGFDEQSAVTELQVYPNPAADVIHVSFNIPEKQQVKLSLVNLTGQVVYYNENPSFSGLYNNDISITNLPSGVYFLKISTATGTVNKKVVVK